MIAIAMAVASACAVAHAQPVRPSKTALGPLEVSPAAPNLSVVVGDAIRFTAAARGAHRFSWSIWGRVVSHDPVWQYVPAPEDAGWQQVQLEVWDTQGNRRTHTWEVGVVAAVAPEVVEVSPPAGAVEVPADGHVTLRCGARVPAARRRDRLRFRWELDDRVLRRDERKDASGSSEVTLTGLSPGDHRVVARVTEDGRVASLVEWSITVAARAPVPAPLPPKPRIVARPPAGRIERREGQPVEVSVEVEPAVDGATFEWLLDGRSVSRGAVGRFGPRPLTKGQHRLVARATSAGAPVGELAWDVVVREVEVAARRTEPARIEEPPTSSTLRGDEVAASPGILAEPEIRAWLEEYAAAWSRKDVDTLQRMGQVRTPAEADRLVRYFGTIDALHVEVRVLGLRVEGGRAAVDLERVDTVTDPTGRRQELRLPPLHKQIERTPDGLRFVDDGRPG